MKPRSPFRNDFFEALAALKLAVAKIEACGELSVDEAHAVMEASKALPYVMLHFKDPNA